MVAKTIWQKGITVLFCQLIFMFSICVAPAFAQEPSKADVLLTNISASYEGSRGAWQVMSLNACGLGATADADTLLGETLAAVNSGTTDSTLFQRNIIGLTAAGYDCAALPDGSQNIDVIDAMGKRVDGSSPINAKVATLLAYASGDYDVPASAILNKEQLVDSICAVQLKDGGFTFYGTVSDADMTALAINALLPYAQENTAAESALSKARQALLALCHEDGSWGSGAQSQGNVNSTAFAIIALCALGIDPTVPLEGCKTSPLAAFVGFSASKNNGFLYLGNLNALATEQGFRALIACKGYEAAGGAYNIYTEASKASAVFKPVAAGGSDAEKPSEPASKPGSNPAPNPAGKPSQDSPANAPSAGDAGEGDKESDGREDSAAAQNNSGSAAGKYQAAAAGDKKKAEGKTKGKVRERSAPKAATLDTGDELEPQARGISADARQPAPSKTVAIAMIACGILLLALAAALYLSWTRGRRSGR